MNRERLAWMLSFVVLAIAAFRNPTSAQRDGDYLFVRTLVDINRQVVGNYVEKVDEKQLEQASINGMLSQLDPFTVYIPPAEREHFDRLLEGSFKGVGIELNPLPNGQIEIVTPIEGSPAFRAGVQAGDIILKVDGKSVEGLKQDDVIKMIKGEPGTEVRLTLKRLTGEELELKMRREDIVMPTIKGYRRKPDNTWDYLVSTKPRIAYVRLTQFTSNTFDSTKAAMDALMKEGMEGLILDLRWNPGGQLDQAVEVVDLFVDKGVIVSTEGRARPRDVKMAKAEGTLPWFPMIVLVNEHSASAAEIVAGSLMDNKRAAVLGERTYGKGSVQEVIRLDDNGELKMTVAYYYLPSGRLVHRKKGATDWGVEPQIVVPMDEETQKRVFNTQLNEEHFHRPTTHPSTKPVAATTQPVDIQLQRAIETMTLMTVLQHGQTASVLPTTRPGQ
jgi:carboxyl-terminal processing protease